MRLYTKWLRCELTLPLRDKELPKEVETEMGEAEEGLPFPRRGTLFQAPEVGTMDQPVLSNRSTRKSKLATTTKRVEVVNENWCKIYFKAFLIIEHLEPSLPVGKASLQ